MRGERGREARARRVEESAFGVIYGAITVLSLLMAFPAAEDDAVRAALVLFGSIVAVVLAKAFAEISAETLRTGRRLGRTGLVAAWRHSRTSLVAANGPSLAIALSATGLYPFASGVVLAQLLAVALLAAYGFRIGSVVYGGRILPATLHGAFTGGTGVVLAALKYLLH